MSTKKNEDSIKRLLIMAGDRTVHNMEMYNRWQAELEKARHEIIDLRCTIIEANRLNDKLISGEWEKETLKLLEAEVKRVEGLLHLKKYNIEDFIKALNPVELAKFRDLATEILDELVGGVLIGDDTTILDKWKAALDTINQFPAKELREQLDPQKLSALEACVKWASGGTQ